MRELCILGCRGLSCFERRKQERALVMMYSKRDAWKDLQAAKGTLCLLRRHLYSVRVAE